MEQHDFINIYIKNLVKEVEELSKSKILLAAKDEFKAAEIDELKAKLTEVEELSVKEKDDVAKTWQLALSEKDQEIAKIQTEMADIRRQLNLKANEFNVKNNEVENLKSELKEKDNVIKSFEKNNKPAQETKAIPIILEPEPKERRKKNKGATLLID